MQWRRKKRNQIWPVVDYIVPLTALSVLSIVVGPSSTICMSPNLVEEILVLFLSRLPIGFLILAIVHFYRSSNEAHSIASQK
jgi:hypothetical protein